MKPALHVPSNGSFSFHRYASISLCNSLLTGFLLDLMDYAYTICLTNYILTEKQEPICAVQVLIYSPDGRCLLKYQAYESGLGVKSISWSPCGQFLAVGSYDQTLRVLNHLTWKTFAEFMHLSTVRGPCFPAVFKVKSFSLCSKLTDVANDD